MKKIYTLLYPCLLLFSSCIDHEISYHTDLGPRVERILDEYKKESQVLKRDEEMASEVHHQQAKAAELVNKPSTNWWDLEMQSPLEPNIESHKKTLEDLLVSTLRNSTQIKVFSDIPLLRETDIKAAEGQFDTIAFLNAQLDRTDRPINSRLELTPQNRLKETEWTIEGGFKKKLITGADIQLKELIGRKDSNDSNFFPDPQGKAELKLRINQPLLKGMGVAYNTTTIRIAEIDQEVAFEEFLRQTEAHLLEVIRAYWNLYQARALYFQKQKLVASTKAILDEIESRQSLDVRSIQLVRVRASYSQRKSDLIRADVAIKNAQDRLKSLIRDPELNIYSEQEIIPIDQPFYAGEHIDLLEAAATALKNRPEILQGFGQLNAALLRNKVARNEILPKLDLFLEGTLSGLSSHELMPLNAWNNQFNQGNPGYAAGINFEYPICNNKADAALSRTRIEIRQQTNQILTVIETVLLEVKVIVREARTLVNEVLAKYDSMVAAREDLVALKARRGVDVGSETQISNYLDFILDSQQRLADAEENFVKSLVTHNIAMSNLQKSQGTLLRYEKIDECLMGTRDFYPCDPLPYIRLNKEISSKAPAMENPNP